jgi:hypothetical protein
MTRSNKSNEPTESNDAPVAPVESAESPAPVESAFDPSRVSPTYQVTPWETVESAALSAIESADDPDGDLPGLLPYFRKAWGKLSDAAGRISARKQAERLASNRFETDPDVSDVRDEWHARKQESDAAVKSAQEALDAFDARVKSERGTLCSAIDAGRNLMSDADAARAQVIQSIADSFTEVSVSEAAQDLASAKGALLNLQNGGMWVAKGSTAPVFAFDAFIPSFAEANAAVPSNRVASSPGAAGEDESRAKALVSYVAIDGVEAPAGSTLSYVKATLSLKGTVGESVLRPILEQNGLDKLPVDRQVSATIRANDRDYTVTAQGRASRTA